MANYNFIKDLTEGEKGEQVIREFLETNGYTFVSDNKDYRYDLEMSSLINEDSSLVKVSTFEVKTDVYCLPHTDTNNLFIEFECRDKNSGINVTEADYYVNYYPYLHEAWFIKTKKLKELIDNNNFVIKEFSGDTNSNTKGYIIPRYQFKKHFKVKIIKSDWD
jgi:hypothetical protein